MKNKKGFSLVELLISLSIFCLLLAVIFYVFGVEIRFWKKTADKGARLQIASMLLTRISRDVRSANGFAGLSSDDYLRMTSSPDNIEYSYVYGKVRRKINGYSAYLTADGDINNLQFSYPGERLVEIKVEGFSTHAAMRN